MRNRGVLGIGKGLRVGLLGGSASVLLWSSFAYAQTPEEPAVTNDIVVTAQRRAEALEDVPMTVAVISQETLSNVGVNTVRELANVTSGVLINNSGAFPQPAIRGITTINAGIYENNVSVFVDGLYQVAPQVLTMELPNVDNVQILKGPQGTLYGRNSTGGAILLDTIDPGPEWTGNVEATYGRFDDKRGRAFVAGPLAEGIGFSIAGTMRRTDGYYKRASRTTPGQFDGRFLGLRQESIRSKLKFDLSDTFTATAAYSYGHSSDPRGVIFTATENVNTPYTGANATRPRELGEAAGDLFIGDLKQHEASLKLELDTGLGKLQSITGYTRNQTDSAYDADGTYAAGGYSRTIIRDRIWQQSLDFTVEGIDNLDLIVGGNYYNISTDYDPAFANAAYNVPAGSAPGTPLSAYRKSQEIYFWRHKEAWATFFDATFHATDRLSINIGGRYSEETQDVAAQKNVYCTATAGCAVGATTVPLGGITATPYTRASSAQGSKYGKFTPRASIRYEIAPRTNIYASYSKGFRAGEWNSVPPSDTNLPQWKQFGQVGQESVDAFEVGFKSARGRFRFDVAAFYYDYKDIQLSTTVFAGPVSLVSLQSMPRAKIKGIEGNFDFEVIDNLTIRGGATYLHARYGDGAVFVGTSINPAGVGYNTNADPLKVFPNAGQTAMDISGMQMSRAPNFSAFLGLDYKVETGAGSLRFAANVKYTDSYVVTNPSIWGGEPLAAYNARKALDPNATPNNNAQLAGTPYADRSNEQRARQGRFALINASMTWTDSSDHIYARIWGNNLTDVVYRTHYNPSTSTYAPIAEPRTFGATIGYKF